MKMVGGLESLICYHNDFHVVNLALVNLYFNGLRYDIWNGVTVIVFVPYCTISLCYL